MSEEDRRIMEKCGETIPKMAEQEKEKLLSFMEGVSFITAMQQQAQPPATMPEQPQE